jgi:hypothetical protein
LAKASGSKNFLMESAPILMKAIFVIHSKNIPSNKVLKFNLFVDDEKSGIFKAGDVRSANRKMTASEKKYLNKMKE